MSTYSHLLYVFLNSLIDWVKDVLVLKYADIIRPSPDYANSEEMAPQLQHSSVNYLRIKRDIEIT